MDDNLEFEIDIFQLLESIKSNIFFIIGICIITSTVMIAYTIFFVEKEYIATGKLVVVQSQSESNNELNYNDVILSQKLTDTYKQILLSERIGEKVLDKIDVDVTLSEYKEKLVVTSIGDTEVINVSIKTTDPSESALIVNTTMAVFEDEIYDIMSIDNVSILDNAKIPDYHSSPNLKSSAAIGFLLGIVISFLIVIYGFLRKNFIMNEDELESLLEVPVIGIIPYYKEEEVINNE